MKIKYQILLCTLFFSVINCKGQNDNERINNIDSIKKSNSKLISKHDDSFNINFLDKKYQINGFHLPDNAPPYPSYSYSDDKIGVFSVDYIGKTTEIQNFWDVGNKKGYFSKFKIPQEAAYLSKEIKGYLNLTDYHVLANYIPYQYISFNGNEDDEFHLKPNALTYYYLYVNNNWKLIHIMNADAIPIDNILKFKTSIIQKELVGSNTSTWRTNCKEGFTYIKINGKNASLVVASNQIYIDLVETKRYDFEKGIAYKLEKIPEDMGRGGMGLNWEEYINDKPIVYVKMIDDNHMYFYWYGFYNKKTKKREFLESDFNVENKSKDIILTKCE